MDGEKAERFGNLRLLLILIGVVVVTTVGSSYTTYLFVRGADRPQAEEAKKDPGGGKEADRQAFGPTFDLGSFTANLRTPPGALTSRFVQARLVVELGDASVAKKLEVRNPAVRDAVLRILREHSAEQLGAPGGMDELAAKVVEAVNEVIGEPGVVQAFFTDLVVQ